MNNKKILSYFAGFFLLAAILLTVIDVCAFNKEFYKYEYARDHQAEKIGMSDEGLTGATDALLDYLQDHRDDIVFVTEVNGVEREVFNERETLHMVDVKALYQKALTARLILLVAAFALYGCLFVTDKNNRLKTLQNSLLGGGGMLAILIGFISIYAAVDFYSFWMNFHYLFFDNDLFLLDPNTSIMINMFPQNLFSDMVFLMIAVFAVILALIAVIIFFLGKRGKGKDD